MEEDGDFLEASRKIVSPGEGTRQISLFKFYSARYSFASPAVRESKVVDTRDDSSRDLFRRRIVDAHGKRVPARLGVRSTLALEFRKLQNSQGVFCAHLQLVHSLSRNSVSA